MVDIDALKQKLVTASHIMHKEGLVEGYGHITIRIPGTDRFLAPPRMSPALVQVEDVLTINLAGEKVDGRRNPNSETWIHTCLYRARPDVNSVAHTHSKMVVALGIVGQVVRPTHNHGVLFSDGVTLFMRPGLINTEELGTETAAAIGNRSALMLRGHGAIVATPELERTTLATIYLEEAAMFQVLAQPIGKPMFYSDEEMANNFPSNVNISDDRRIVMTRGWDYYVSRVS